MPSKCAVGNILYSWNYAYNHERLVEKTKNCKRLSLTLKSSLEKEEFIKVQCLILEVALAADGIKPGKGGAKIYDSSKTEEGVDKSNR